MLEKSNGTGALALRQKVLLTARLRVSLFFEFSTIRKMGNLQKNFLDSRDISEIFGIPGIREISENFREKFCRA